MSIPQNFPGQVNINSFLPAILKENKSGWLIEYYIEHPATHILTRKQIKLQRIISRYKSTKEARQHVNKMLVVLNAKLAGGWNPFFSTEDARLYEQLTVITDKFLKEKKKELRDNSYRSYSSFVTIFLEYINKTQSGIYGSLVTQLIAVQYMDYVYDGRNVGVTTYNNHIKMGRALFNWMKERCYCKENPFDNIKPKAKQNKTRTIIPSNIRKKIIIDLKKNSPNFLIICKLIFNSLIRPTEIKQLTISNVNLEKKYIYIPGNVAKNHKSRFAAINEDIINEFKKMNLDRYPLNYYLFSSDLNPAKDRAGNGRYGEEWVKMKKRLKLPDVMQMYSLRDSGIFEMLKSGIDDLSVMQHADHSSLEMTTLYGNHHDPNLINLIYSKSPLF